MVTSSRVQADPLCQIQQMGAALAGRPTPCLEWPETLAATVELEHVKLKLSNALAWVLLGYPRHNAWTAVVSSTGMPPASKHDMQCPLVGTIQATSQRTAHVHYQLLQCAASFDGQWTCVDSIRCTASHLHDLPTSSSELKCHKRADIPP